MANDAFSNEPPEISRQIRKNIFDGLLIENIYWSGCLNDVEFLERIFDLESMPSHDPRYSSAARDIWQHTVNNDDFELGWIFTDPRFNLLGCSDSEFLSFLAETIHPVVRPDNVEAKKLAQHYNAQLEKAGWRLVEVESIAGRPRYEGRKQSSFVTPVSEARRVADALEAGWMHREIVRMEQAVETDPDLAIGTAKDLIESCCKSLLEKIHGERPDDSDFPDLVRQTVKALKLTRNDISDASKGAETIRVLLSNLSAITRGINELRNLYGTGHGRSGGHRGLEPRHARLVVTAAVGFVVFVADTYEQRLLNEPDKPSQE